MLDTSGNDDIMKPTDELPEFLRFGRRITTPTAVVKYEPSQVLIDMDDNDFYMLSCCIIPTSITFKAEKELNYEQLKYMITRLVKNDTVVNIAYYKIGYNHTITLNCPIAGGYELVSTACTNYELELDICEFRINFDNDKSIAALINNETNFVCRCLIYTNYSYILFEETIRPLLSRFALSTDSTGRFGILDILHNHRFTDYMNFSTIVCALSKKNVSMNLTYTYDVDFSKSKTLKHNIDEKYVYSNEYKNTSNMIIGRSSYTSTIQNVKHTMTGNFIDFIDFITIDGCIPKVELFHA